MCVCVGGVCCVCVCVLLCRAYGHVRHFKIWACFVSGMNPTHIIATFVCKSPERCPTFIATKAGLSERGFS